MKSFVFISFFLLTAIHAFPQKKISGTVRGTIVDTAGKQDLSQATVSVTPVDSRFQRYSILHDRQEGFIS